MAITQTLSWPTASTASEKHLFELSLPFLLQLADIAQDNQRLLLSHSLFVIFHAQRPHFYRPHGRGEPNLLAHGTQRMQSGFVPSMTALSVPQHKPMCTIAFGGSTRIDDIALGLRRKKSFSLQQRELVETSAALSTTCLSTSVPHSLGTCLETGIYTTGGVVNSDLLCFLLLMLVSLFLFVGILAF